ncbi:hypothetical protein [Streptomyces sp. BBFR102]
MRPVPPAPQRTPAKRLRTDAPLNEVDPVALHGGGGAGYTDYPALAHV